MDSSHPPTLNTLRNHAYAWLYGLRRQLTSFTQPATQVPPPNYPVPLDFPYLGRPLSEYIRWNERQGQLVVLHSVHILFQFHGPRDQSWSGYVWSVHSGPTRIGLVEIDPRFLRDSQPVVPLNPEFFLDAMMFSLQAGGRLRVSSHIISLPADPARYPETLRNSEIFQMRANGRVIRNFKPAPPKRHLK